MKGRLSLPRCTMAFGAVAAVLLAGMATLSFAAEPIDGAEPVPVYQSRLSFADLGHQQSLELQGSESSVFLGFGSRLDETVDEAELLLDYTVSPSLRAVYSHLKVYLNNELMGSIPFSEADIGQRRQSRVSLDPRYFGDFNSVRVELIGHLTDDCWNPDEPTIWTELSQSSEVLLSVKKRRLRNDLALLPAPFFDERDFTALELPVVLPSDYSLGVVHAAALTSSYFGSLSTWRGASFPVEIDTLPERHSIVLMTNNQRPRAFAEFPQVDKPTLQVISHPDNPYVKLLLIQGRDDSQLITAVKGLALGQSLLTGQVAEINSVDQLKPRQPYDAPNWVRTDRPVKLGELVNDLTELQVSGRLPGPVNISLQVPPDLFTWQSRGIPLDVSYRYSPTAGKSTGSKMNFFVNNQFVEGFNLTPRGIDGEEKELRVPLLDDGLVGTGDRVRIPAFRVGTRNRLSFQFAFSAQVDGSCRVVPAGSYQAAITGDSTIDFTGFPHYIEMPNLHAFVTAGFPFSRLADLADTAMVVPPQPGPAVVQSLLDVSGFIGASTGYPGLAMTVTDNLESDDVKAKNLLLIDVAPGLGGKVGNNDNLHLLVENAERQLRRPLRNDSGRLNAERETQDSAPVDQVSLRAEGAFAAIVGMESPFKADRSVVAIVADKPKDLLDVGVAMRDSGKLPYMFGSVVTIRGDRVASFHVGDNYYVGELPLLQLIWFHFSKHPVLLAFMALLLIVLLTLALWRILAVYAARRLKQGNDS
ncbi:cellulose biosynthesis cyclic di-GMP-binding regulatory protein BcsB [Spongiibacter nanhainus]|uniref:Cyclic di-GMP-binding protein n=1 Tax=Spongiibacter nanhainus TaxID=2794344 RepID=A0A7T4QZW0_9GAMM|nr:cellulose biosynthesis cyclic di-GMP-binding regulatory protein BcsB [Spongiibacter nanhainus]QQD17821.1 cellulose biosynthesis cyclic di-GMP-binding regulatory protein BcsB [Spongiibacter nanhainus]